MYRQLSVKGVKVPNGFAVTAEACRVFLNEKKLDAVIRSVLKDLGTHDLTNPRTRGRQMRQAILGETFSPELAETITDAYDRPTEGQSEPVDVAVRSSATAEDLPDKSFAGQQETYLNVQGHLALLEHSKRCFAVLFTDRAIAYRVEKGFDHQAIALSIGVRAWSARTLPPPGACFLSIRRPAYRSKRLGSKEFKLIYDEGAWKLVGNRCVAAGRPMRRRNREWEPLNERNP